MTPDTAALAAAAGANEVVAGSAVFHGGTLRRNIRLVNRFQCKQSLIRTILWCNRCV